MISPNYRKQIRQIFYYYKKLLTIPLYWHVSIEANEKIKEYANVEYNYQEKVFNISINPKLNQDLDNLKDSILHELIHILFTPATTRIDLLLHKIECGEKVNAKKARKKMLAYEECLVRHMTMVIINQEKEKK